MCVVFVFMAKRYALCQRMVENASKMFKKKMGV